MTAPGRGFWNPVGGGCTFKDRKRVIWGQGMQFRITVSAFACFFGFLGKSFRCVCGDVKDPSGPPTCSIISPFTLLPWKTEPRERLCQPGWLGARIESQENPWIMLKKVAHCF
eukprot:EG_transcript_18726